MPDPVKAATDAEIAAVRKSMEAQTGMYLRFYAEEILALIARIEVDGKVIEAALKELRSRPCSDEGHPQHPCGEWLDAKACRVSKVCQSGRAIAALAARESKDK